MTEAIALILMVGMVFALAILRAAIEPEELDYRKIDDVFLEFDYEDFPDFCDAYITGGVYDGRPMTDDEVDKLNDDRQFVHDQVWKHIH